MKAVLLISSVLHGRQKYFLTSITNRVDTSTSIRVYECVEHLLICMYVGVSLESVSEVLHC